jgi:NADH-quinone oxidoreductase subunit K
MHHNSPAEKRDPGSIRPSPTVALLKDSSARLAMTYVFTIDILRNYLLVGAALFSLGILGFLSRRNLIVMFLSAEMMLQGTALSLVAFGRYHGNWTGQVFTIVILTVAACEASIALALIVILYNRRSSLDVTLWQDLREESVPSGGLAEEEIEAEPLEQVRGPESYPSLTPAGIEPAHPVLPWLERRE